MGRDNWEEDLKRARLNRSEKISNLRSFPSLLKFFRSTFTIPTFDQSGFPILI